MYLHVRFSMKKKSKKNLIDNRKAKNYNFEMTETALYAVLEKNKNADTKRKKYNVHSRRDNVPTVRYIFNGFRI